MVPRLAFVVPYKEVVLVSGWFARWSLPVLVWLDDASAMLQSLVRTLKACVSERSAQMLVS